MNRVFAAGLFLIAGFGVVVTLTKRPEPPRHPRVPVTEDMAQINQGKKLFARNCMRCHGPEATGTRIGPPLVHKIYEPSHHGDAAFFMAVSRGVKSHHWKFGDMVPVPGVKPEDVALIVGYVRWLQRKAGIF
ncbi:MAG: cytochrome c [Nitrospinae bacterium]|nr:cytochrome c [Nitrospinota bacterium]